MEIPGAKSHACRTSKIRELNDRLRQRHEGGRILLSSGVADLPVGTIARIMVRIRDFAEFGPQNDPYQEHDFGRVLVDEHEIFWKLDSYSTDLESGSPDPSDETVTCRVMTVFLAEEY
jgi:hypothetical protein